MNNFTPVFDSSIDGTLVSQLLDEEQKLERSFILRSWQYSQLDGGRFCEAAARTLYSVDSGNAPKDTLTVDAGLKYIEDDTKTHLYLSRKSLIHITKIIRSVYRLRSQRGAIHLNSMSADELDSRYVLIACRWILAEMLRLFADASRQETEDLFVKLSKRPVTMLRDFGSIKLVQNTKLTAAEEILVYMYLSDSEEIMASELCASIPKDNSGIKKSLTKLSGSKIRDIVRTEGGWRLTDIGISHAENIIANNRE